ncbi:hypothetical protein ASG87_18620 [Frateuria sp. Soil773]|uniref:YjbF family lipoprotein n=1 Tax=Frateuria sp. Soil773 TaxID=1736407 RepID=UPI000701A5D5|nr:YjbF family lipoprotein [Frateuria sp. Soil773]KRE91165.1 hypothetical protein ASG87_18620 [Frateuria sp. Soil773]
MAGLLVLLGIHGCTEVSRSSIDALKMATRGGSHRPTAAEVAARPYYQMQVAGNDGTAVLILGNIDGSREAWYGAHQVVVFTEHGRVVQTAGLSQNLDAVRLPADDPFARGLQTLAAPVEYTRFEDWSPGYRYGVPVHARLVPAGRETIDILGTPHEVLRIDEQLDAPAAGYRATNRYWVDPQDGFIWKSTQQIAPGSTLQLLQLKPHRATAP